MTVPVARTLSELRSAVRGWQDAGERVSVVPTMGALHAGHLSLVRAAKDQSDRVIVTLFVNPTQFGDPADLETYPRTEADDARKLAPLGVDLLYAPGVGEIYPEGFATTVSVAGVSASLCGAFRPGHFDAVATVMAKLFLKTAADIAFFGEKDRQQLEVIRKMVTDLNLDVEIVGLPIIREPDGLAMSSRNRYLGKTERETAKSLHQALQQAQQLVTQGESSAEAIRTSMRTIIEREGQVKVDYISVCDPKRFEELEEIQGKAMIALAVHVGKARLIDNCLIERI